MSGMKIEYKRKKMNINPINAIDFYKAGHIKQYPEGTTQIFSNFTPRSSKYFNGSSLYDEKVLNFGMQYFIKDFLIDCFNKNFFNQPREIVLEKYKTRIEKSLGEKDPDISHIENLHKLGYLPINIKTHAEGSRTPINEPVLTITNTHPDFYWIVNYLETVMSADLWKLYTNATIAFEYRRVLEKYYELTGSNPYTIPLSCHDFSARGMSGKYDQAISGVAHLTSFIGTDTVLSIDAAEEFYNADENNDVIGVSVPATEHSVMCAGGKDTEIETYRRLIEKLYPTGIVAIVSDTWDYWKVITEYLPAMKDIIMSRQYKGLLPGKVVIRPDSGDPIHIIAGYRIFQKGKYEKEKTIQENIEISDCKKMYNNYYEVIKFVIDNKNRYFLIKTGEEIPEHIANGSIHCLYETFGGLKTNKNFKQLDPHIGLIYGDSITIQRQEEILSRLADKGYASNCIIFGVGSYTYQMNSRDTLGFAMKATYATINGEGHEIFKDPKTDDGTKKSAKGLCGIFLNEDTLKPEFKQGITIDEECSEKNLLKTVFLNGSMTKETSLTDIRAIIDSEFI